MQKSKPLSKPEPSPLADEIKTALLPLSLPDAESDSAQSSEPPPSTGETQSIGNLTFPRLAWTLAWTPNPTTLLFKLGGDLIQVRARGAWDKPQPPNSGPTPLPDQRPDETGPAYFFRALQLYRQPNRRSPEFQDWAATRKWVGEASSDLLAALRAGQDLPGRSWTFITERTSTSTYAPTE